GRGHLAGAALAAAVCLGWAGLAVGLTGWDVFYETVSREALQRLSPSHHLEALQELSPSHQPQVYPWAAVLLHPFRTLAARLPSWPSGRGSPGCGTSAAGACSRPCTAGPGRTCSSGAPSRNTPSGTASRCSPPSPAWPPWSGSPG